MPNPGLGEEVVKVTLNLFKRDVEVLKKLHSSWSAEVRDIVRVHLRTFRAYELAEKRSAVPKTLGDLDD